MVLDKLTYQARNRTLDRTVRSDCYELARVRLPNATRYTREAGSAGVLAELPVTV